MTITFKASEPDPLPTDGTHPGYHIDQIDSNRGNQSHWAKITVWGDEALRDRILAFLNTEPVMYAAGNHWFPVSALEGLLSDEENPRVYAVHLIPVGGHQE